LIEVNFTHMDTRCFATEPFATLTILLPSQNLTFD